MKWSDLGAASQAFYRANPGSIPSDMQGVPSDISRPSASTAASSGGSSSSASSTSTSTAAAIPPLPDYWKSAGFTQYGGDAYNPNWAQGNKPAAPASVFYDTAAKQWSTYAMPLSTQEWGVIQGQHPELTTQAGAGAGTTAQPTAKPLPEIPAGLAANGFKYIPGTSDVYSPNNYTKTGTNGTYGYLDSRTNTWTTYAATPQQAAFAKAGGATGTPATGTPTTTPQTTSAVTGQPAPAATPGAAAPAAPAAPTATPSPFSQANAATRSTVFSNPAMGPTPMSMTVPQNYQEGPSGFNRTLMPGGGTQDIGVAHQVQFSPFSPTAPAAAAPPSLSSPLVPPPPAVAALPSAPPPATPPPNPINPTGGVGTAPYGPPSPVAPQSIRPPDVGDAGLSQPTVINGVTIPPATVAAIRASWPVELVPQALAIAARESGGNPAADNSKGYQGGPLNNDPKYGNAPGSPYYNSVDYGLFGINDRNFASLGLTPDTARDPMANAAAAYQLYQRAGGWSPWGGNGTIPLPPPASSPWMTMANNATNEVRNGTLTGAPVTTPPVGADVGTTPAPTAPVGPTPTSLYGQGQIWHLGGMSQGYNPMEILRDNGIRSTGDADKDAVLAASIIQQQVPGGGYGDPLASKPVGASTFFQSPLSGGLQNEQRTSAGYAFSPGNVNATESFRSPMNSGAVTPVMTPGGVVINSANQQGQSPAAQAQAYQQAGYGQPVLNYANNPAGDRQNLPNSNTLATYPIAPTSNVGAVIQAAQAQNATPQQPGQFFTGDAYLAGSNPNSNLGPTPVGYASAANLPSGNELQALGAANAQTQADQDKAAADAAAAAAGGGPMGGGNTQYFAQGGSFTLNPNTNPLLSLPPNLQRAAQDMIASKGRMDVGGAAMTPGTAHEYGGIGFSGGGGISHGKGGPNDLPGGAVYNPTWDRPGTAGTTGYANGGNFITTRPTVFPVAGGGRAVTSEYGQPEMEHLSPVPGGRVQVHVMPMRGYADGGTFTTPTDPLAATPSAASSTGGGFNNWNTQPKTNPGGDTTPAPVDPTAPLANLDPLNPSAPQTPADQNYNAPPAAPAPPAPPPTIAPSAFQQGLDTGPEQGIATTLANRQFARDTQGYLRHAAGVPDPIGIQSQTPLTGLAPNQYWAPIDYTPQIQSLQQRLASLGPVTGDPTQLAFDLQAAQNGYGGNGPGQPGWVNPDPVRAAQIQQQLSSMTAAADLMNQIANLRANQPQLTGYQTAAYNAPPASAAPAPTIPTKQNPNLGLFLSALADQSSSGKVRDPMKVAA